MKKFICLILALLVLISCCACGQTPAAGNENETDPVVTTNGEEKDPFAEINEFAPDEDGNYQIYTAQGLLNMANHLDGSFILLGNIDLGGIDWAPIGSQSAPFTGKFNGNNFTISNFTITTNTVDGDMAMFGVNAGNIVNVRTEKVTVTTTAETKQAGLLVGTNQGKVRRGNVAGVINAQVLAENAKVGGLAGYSKDLLETTTADVDILCSAAGKASVGGIVGFQEGNIVRSCVAAGQFQVTGGTNKSVGLFAGVANDAELVKNQFVGEINKVDSKLFLECIGTQTAKTTNTEYAIRDNSRERVVYPADVQARRDKVIAVTYAMATTPWTVTEPLMMDYTCSCCKDITFIPGKTYRGIPYNHKNGSLQRFQYCLAEGTDEQGRYTYADWVYDYQGSIDTWDIYVGNDCSSAVQQIYATVCDEVEFYRSRTQFPCYNFGTIPVGKWGEGETVQPDGYTDDTYKEFIAPIGEAAMYENYALLRAADLIGNVSTGGGHCRVIMQDPVVMLDQEGNLDPDASYVLVCEQVANFADFEEDGGYTSSWRTDKKYTFRDLMSLGYVPMTFECLVNSVEDVTEVTVEDTLDGRLGLTTGIVASTRNLDSVEMVITDDAGNEILRQRMFTTAGKTTDSGSEYFVVRKVPKTYDLANFTAAVSQIQWDLSKTYHCTITALLSCGDAVVAREFDF